MSNFLTRSYLLIVMMVLSSQIMYSQGQTSSAFAPFTKKNSEVEEKTSRVRWTWQLPSVIKTSFYNSSYNNWYIEKIVRHDSGGKTVYRFYINNGSFLDSDHHDSFLECYYIDISNNGTILMKVFCSDL